MHLHRLFALLACLMLSWHVNAETISFIANGMPNGTSASGQWHTSNGTLTGEGMGNLLTGNYVFKWERGLAVDVDLSLDKLDGTAASIMLGKNNFVIDAREGLLYEAPGKTAQAFPFPDDFQAGKRFNCFITVNKDNTAFWYIDNRKVGEVAEIIAEDGWTCALRPHRNCMRVSRWEVDCSIAIRSGQELEVASVEQHRHFLTQPVEKTITAINNDAILVLPFCQPNDIGPCEFEMHALPNGSCLVWEGTVSPNGGIALPQEKLQKIFESSTLERMIRPVELTLSRNGQAFRKRRLGLYDQTVHGNFPKGEIRVTNGYAEKYIDGRPVGTISNRLGRAYGEHFLATTIKNFAAAGIDGNLVIVNPFEFMDKETFEFDQNAFLQNFESYALRTIAENPNARFQLHWQLMVPATWGDAHPDELIGLDNNVKTLSYGPENKLQPSYASVLWRETSGKILRSTVRILQNSPWADRIAELRVLYANCGEWNHWGYQEQAFTDFSRPMQVAFAEWLQEKYGNVDNLRKTWGKENISFEDNLIPTREQRLADKGTFRMNGNESQPSVDYYEFFQKMAARTIEYFTRIAKEASDNRLLVGSYYGYYWGHVSAAPYHSLDSGNFGVRYLLESQWIDFIGGPYPYGERRDGCEINGFPRSLALHGKIWESEGDMRTHRSGEDQRQYGTTDNLAESIEVAKRDYALNRSAGSCYYFFDFVDNWYDDPEFMDTVAKLVRIDNFLRERKDSFPRRVAIVVSEEMVPHLSNTESPWLWRITEGERSENPRIGIPYDVILDADLKFVDFSQYQAVIFQDAYYASDETIRLVKEKIRKNGRKTIFYYSPGIVSPENQYDLDRSEQLTGIRLELDETKGDTIVRLKNGTAAMDNGAVSPRIFVNDKQANVFAEFADGVPAAATKSMPDGCESIIISHPQPNHAFMREVLDNCGLKIYQTKGNAQCYFAGPMLAIYSRGPGSGEFELPDSTEIVADFFTGEIIAENTSSFKMAFPSTPQTRMLFVGLRKDWQAYLEMLEHTEMQ